MRARRPRRSPLMDDLIADHVGGDGRRTLGRCLINVLPKNPAPDDRRPPREGGYWDRVVAEYRFRR